MEESTENVAEEIKQEEVVQPTEEKSSTTENPPESQNTSSDTDKEYNFNQLRKSKEQLELRVNELESYFKNLKEESEKTKLKSDNDFDIADEELAEGKHLKKVYSELNSLKDQIQRERLASIPERLKTKYQDFDQVVSVKNIERLKNEEPELYSTLTAGNDLYTKGVAAYKAVMALGYANPQLEAQKNQVQQNHKRPMSAHSVKGQGALSEQNIFAGGLTPELKKRLQTEMSEAAKAH